MLGTIINTISIIIGGTIGTVFGSRFSKRYSDIVLNAIALSSILVGLLSATKTENVLLLIGSMALGSLLGEFFQIEAKLDKVGAFLQEKFSHKGGNIAEGFVTTTLIYCVGSMAILGAIESGVNGVHTTLFAKSALDGVSSIVFASTLGIGVIISSVSVFIYQGAITLLASNLVAS